MLERDHAHRIGAGFAAAVLLALLALATPAAVATGWRPPQTVADDGFTNALNDFSGFLSTRDGSHVDVVTLREAKGIVVEPVRPGGSLGRGTWLPGSRHSEYPWRDGQAEFAADGQYPNAAVNDAGLVAVAWRSQNEINTFSEQPCDCAIRLAVGVPGHRFNPVVLSGRSNASKEILGVQVSPTGRVRVLYVIGTGGHPVLAETERPWRAIHRRRLGLPVHPFGEPPDYVQPGEAAGREEMFVEAPGQVRLAQEPFTAPGPPELTWPAGEGSGTVLSDSQGLVMGLLANTQTDALEVTTPSTSGPSGDLHPVLAPLPATGSGHACLIGGAMNDRGEALVTWRCDRTGPQDALQAALLDPNGHVIALSAIGEPGYGYGGASVWLDDAGHGIVAYEGTPYRYVLLDGEHFSGWGSLQHGQNDAQSTIAVATTPTGLGLASWAEESDGEHPGWAERLQIDQIQIGGGRAVTAQARR